MQPFPVASLRARFPALRRAEVVYLDNASGAQVPDRVVEAVSDALVTLQVNKGGASAPSRRVTARKESVRARTAAFLNAEKADDVAFGPNATTLVTLLARSVGDALSAGDEIVVTSLDHHANVDPWRQLAARGVVVRTWRPRPPFGTLDVADLTELVGSRTRLVAFTGASNALGTLVPIAEAAAVARAAGAWSFVDLVHLAPHALPDVRAWGVDGAVFSPYKIFAPHLGVLYLAPSLRERLAAPRLVFHDPNDPVAWEPGTQSHEAILGWGGALDHLDDAADALDVAPGSERLRWTEVYRRTTLYEADLTRRLLTGLDGLGVDRYGLPTEEGRTATVAFNHPERSAGDVALALAEAGVAVAAGHFYAFDLIQAELGLAARGGAVRVSALHYTDAGDVETFLAAVGTL